MITAWFKNTKDQEDKKQLESSLRHSKWILELQNEIIDRMEGDLDQWETSTKSYDNPNWAFKQADNNGFRRALRAIKRLNNLDLKEQIIDRQPVVTV